MTQFVYQCRMAGHFCADLNRQVFHAIGPPQQLYMESFEQHLLDFFAAQAK